MKNSKLKFSEYMQNISRSKSFGKFVLIVFYSFSAVNWIHVSMTLVVPMLIVILEDAVQSVNADQVRSIYKSFY